MELSEFVENTLNNILSGISAAQEEGLGSNINASAVQFPENGKVFDGAYGIMSLVDFDVAVTAERSAKGEGQIKVFGVGGGGGGGVRSQHESRIKFSVPVRLPEGDTSRKDERDARNRAAYSRRSDDYGTL